MLITQQLVVWYTMYYRNGDALYMKEKIFKLVYSKEDILLSKIIKLFLAAVVLFLIIIVLFFAGTAFGQFIYNVSH